MSETPSTADPDSRDNPPPFREMRIGEILHGAVTAFRAQWKPLMGIVALLVVPFNFLEAYLTRHISWGFGWEPYPAGFGEEIVYLAVLDALYLLLILPMLSAALAHASVRACLGKRVEVAGTYRFALPLAPSVLWILLLFFLAVVLGFLLLVIPGIIAVIRLSFAPITRITEGRRGGAAVSRSWRLSQGFFWKILWTVGVFATLPGALFLATDLLYSRLGPDAWLLSAVGHSVTEVITTPFAILVTVFLYFDLRIRKESFNVEAMGELEGFTDR